jgi:purine-cytosine permease-like protein
MSETPDPVGREEPESYVPSGLRRSTFSPAPVDAPLPTWDDDALAAAMEEEVRTYTSPITLPVLPPPEPASRVQAAPPDGMTGSLAEREAPAEAEAPPEPEPPVPAEPGTPTDDEQLLQELQGASTADAIQRLEQELERRAGTGPTAVTTPAPPFFDGEPPEWPRAPGPDRLEPGAAIVEPDPLKPGAAMAEPVTVIDTPSMAEPGPPLPSVAEPPDLAQRAELPPPPGYAEDGSVTPGLGSPIPEPPDGDAWEQLFTAPIAVPRPEVAETPAPEPHVASAPETFAPEILAPEPFAPETLAPETLAPEPFAPEARVPEALAVETAGLEPTLQAQRAGRAARLFWLWFAANASVVSVALGAVMLGTGMSLRQAIVASVIGIALSFIPLGFGTLAGRRSAQPTLVVSRAAFGLTGNAVPAALAIVVRVFWGGVLLWLLADAVGQVLVGDRADAGLGENAWVIVVLAAGLVVATLVATLGYGLLARVQLVLSVVTAVLIVASAVVTLPQVHLDVALTRQDGPWILVAGAAVLVFSFVGLAWAHSGSDLARYQRPGDSGASSMLWATFGATIPPFLLVVWGALLAASNPRLATGLATHPLAALVELLPTWAPIPLLIAAGVGLLSGSVLTLYSGGFAVQALVPRLSRPAGVLVAAILVLGAGVALVLLGTDTRMIVRDLAVTLAVPVAAWAGIFAAEIMLRQRRFHSASLLARGGVYPTVRWVNLVGLVVISVIGYGFVVGGRDWLGWQGFGWRLVGVHDSDPLATTDLGVLLALGLGILLPLVSALRTVRRQEAAVAGPIAART